MVSLKDEVRRAEAQGQKVVFMICWMFENVNFLKGLTTKERKDFAKEYFGGPSYSTEMGYAIKTHNQLKLDPNWRSTLLGW
jgi:hypothetical protein